MYGICVSSLEKASIPKGSEIKHSSEVMDLIESGKLFPASDLLNPEKAKSDTDKAEVDNAKETKMV